MKSDEVQFVAIPVFSNSHIYSELNELKSSNYLRSIIFINCAGSLDLTKHWIYQRENVKCYLMDCHRPFNHKIVNEDQSKLFIIHDGCKSFDECPTAEEDAKY